MECNYPIGMKSKVRKVKDVDAGLKLQVIELEGIDNDCILWASEVKVIGDIK